MSKRLPKRASSAQFTKMISVSISPELDARIEAYRSRKVKEDTALVGFTFSAAARHALAAGLDALEGK